MKPTLQTAFSVIVLFTISCTKESSQNSSLVSTPSSGNSVAAHYIGQHYGGGVIFYIDTTGQHGLIADTVDFDHIEWWNGTFIITGATAKGIGKGSSNTKKIISAQGKTGNYAALICSKYKGSGYTDWFLPSKNELNELYKQKDLVGGFTSSFYWTSSEYFLTNYWLQFFSNGLQSFAGPNNNGYVRPVRAF